MSQAPQPPPTGPPADDQPPSGSGGSRNLWTVLGVGGGVAVLAVVLFLLLRPDDDSENTADTTPTVQTTTSVETTTATEQTTTEQATTTAPADQPQRVVIRVENAEPVGGVQEYDVEQGEQVILVVHADVEDEVHLHGYDLAAEVAPNQPARIRFRADDVGQFEIELEERTVPIGELVVS
jgi:hypothetical protein